MSETAITQGAHHVALTVPGLGEKYRRVLDRHGRLNRLVEMRAPGIVVRNEKRMLKAALEDLLGDVEVKETISRIGAGVFTSYLNYIAGAEIESSAMDASGDALRA